jgi:hypothetical protein
MRALGSICDTTSTLYVTKRNSVFPDVEVGTMCFKLDNHVVEDDATLNPMDSDLKICSCLNIVPELSKRLESPFQSSKDVFNTDTNLNK